MRRAMMPEEQDPIETEESCPECQVGSLRRSSVPYYAKLDGMLITVPNFPAWVCDVCRHCEYDEDALEALRAILGPAAHIPHLVPPRRRVPAESLIPWTRTGSHKGSK
jgi:YgiT-type zinc finger domain-containing protein